MINDVTTAWLSIVTNKVRSLLTLLGVVIGVAAVTTLVSLGQGLKQDVSAAIAGFGTNVIVVVSGKINTTRPTQWANNPANLISGDILTPEDVAAVEKVPGVVGVTPISLVPGNLKAGDKTAVPTLFGVYPNFLDVFVISALEQGQMFDRRNGGNVIVLGSSVQEDLFGPTSPLEQKVTLGEESFEVIGALGRGKGNTPFDNQFAAITLIPYDTAKRLNKNQDKIIRIIAKTEEASQVREGQKAIREILLANHRGEEDFTVLTQDNILELFNTFLNLATTLVSAIAAISLIVGGIGIMNIMLVTVTERTREIGLRKAVGATKAAILGQFLTEAIIITLIGALIGLGLAFITGAVIGAKTELNPVITLNVIGLAAGISIAIGLIFGLWPAVRAANKDPVEALRYE